MPRGSCSAAALQGIRGVAATVPWLPVARCSATTFTRVRALLAAYVVLTGGALARRGARGHTARNRLRAIVAEGINEHTSDDEAENDECRNRATGHAALAHRPFVIRISHCPNAP